MRKVATILVALALATSSITAANAADQYTPERVPMASDDSQIMMMITEEGLVDNQTHIGVPPRKNKTQDNERWLWCDKSTDKACDYTTGDNELDAQSVLPVCGQSTSAFCVEGLELANATTDFTAAKYVRTATGGPRNIADAKHNLIEGTSSSIFESAAVPSASGTNSYTAIVTVRQHYDRASKTFSSYSMNAVVVPTRDDQDPKYGKISADGNGAGATNMCAYYDLGHCGIPQDFAAGTKVRLKIRIPSEIGGWFRGRIKNPLIAVSAAAGNANQITIEGEPVTVPRLAIPLTKSALTDSERSLINQIGNWGTPSGSATGTHGSHKEAMQIIENYRKTVKDTATGVSSFWSMSSMENGNGSACLSDTSKVLGIVTTNSMAYNGAAPSFSKGTLDYQVAGLHYMPDGKAEVEGTYDLVMRSETARCLYGFTKAPISATISVTAASGEAKVATTLVSEKDGWLKLAAYGFTFSSPTISVKLSQAKAPATKTTIICAKGKVTKKVTGVGPKCPAGYKKK